MDLHQSTLGLKFTVLPEHFTERGKLKIKCTATIASIYWKSNVRSAEGIKQKRASPTNFEEARGKQSMRHFSDISRTVVSKSN